MKLHFRTTCRSLIVLVIVLVVGQPGTCLRYRVTPLTSAYVESSAYAINSSGDVAGKANNQAVVWRNGLMTCVAPPSAIYSWANGISDNGVVTGVYCPDINGSDVEFRWRDGLTEDFDDSFYYVSSGEPGSRCSSDGSVVGTTHGTVQYTYPPPWEEHTIEWIAQRVGLYTGSGVVDLGPRNGNLFGSSGQGFGISKSGNYLTGYGGEDCFGPGEFGHAVLMTAGGAATDLGHMEGHYCSWGYDVNDLGHVVGVSRGSNGYHGVIWRDGQMIDLGITIPRAINNSDVVVGESAQQNAILWQDGVMSNLNDLAVWDDGIDISDYGGLSGAEDINDNGQIAANLFHHAALLTPFTEPLVKSILPGSATNVGVTHIADLSGYNFLAGASVKLKRPGQPDIVGTNVAVEVDTHISCDIDLAGAAPGLWSIVVTNPNGESDTLENAFAVVLPNTAPLVGAANRCTRDTAMFYATGWLRFKFWGKVTVIDDDHLLLDDGSGNPVNVLAPEHSIVADSFTYAAATGSLDVSVSSVVLLSSAEQIQVLWE